MTVSAAGWLCLSLLAAVHLPGAKSFDVAQVPLLSPDDRVTQQTRIHDFRLRHIFHHGRTYSHIHRRYDAPDAGPEQETLLDMRGSQARYLASSQSTRMQKLVDSRREHIESLQAQGRARDHSLQLPQSEWSIETMSAPNVSDVQTIATLARMTLNAYSKEPGTGDWQDVGAPFNHSDSFGWMTDGLRGHVFADTKNETVVIAIKGTSISLTGLPEGPTGSVENDRRNDNLLFSCCCGGGNLLVGPVCDCATGKNSCNSTCVTESLKRPNTYYTLAKELYWNVTELYPKADIWLTGHSLGGSIAALLGATVFVPAVTFEAPGEAMAARRLGLPTPPEYQLGTESHEFSLNKGAYHFGHTADPIFMGTCEGLPCSLEGFFMQSVCHSGSVCVWDAQKDLGWRQSVINHRIITVVNDLIPKYNTTPECVVPRSCTDCSSWKYYESHHSKPATTATTSKPTTTATCTSPGWFGCLDPTSTTHLTTTSTSTCKTPGWFGCKDRVTPTSTSSTTTSTVPSTTTSTSTSTTTSCRTPGWFGCKDPATATTSAANIASPGPASLTSTPRATLMGSVKSEDTSPR